MKGNWLNVVLNVVANYMKMNEETSIVGTVVTWNIMPEWRHIYETEFKWS